MKFLLILFFSSFVFSQNLKTDGKIIVDGSGNEVLLRGYAPGGWLLIEGYMMHETDGSIGAQHQIKSNLISKTFSFASSALLAVVIK